MNYTTMKKDIFFIVATLEDFRLMLLGANIHIYRNHKKLMLENLISQRQRVLRLHFYIEEYARIHYIERDENVVHTCLL